LAGNFETKHLKLEIDLSLDVRHPLERFRSSWLAPERQFLFDAINDIPLLLTHLRAAGGAPQQQHWIFPGSYRATISLSSLSPQSRSMEGRTVGLRFVSQLIQEGRTHHD
jgi:hypothetical protein